MASPTIQIVFNGKVLQTLPFHKPILSIGRMRENDIVIDNLGVSRFHAKLVLENNQITLEDQGSENGTFVNGHLITKTPINPDDEVIIGKHQLIFISAEEESASMPLTSLFEAQSESPTSSSQPWDVSSTFVVDAQTQEKILERIHRTAQKLQSLAQASAKSPTTPIDPEHVLPLNPRLILNHEGLTEQIIRIESNTLTLGRSVNCDIVLDQPQVSRRHCLLEKIGNRFRLQDLDTGDGTFVNGEKIRSHYLIAGDEIRVGNFKLTLRIDNAHELTPPSEQETLEVPKPDFPLPEEDYAEIQLEPLTDPTPLENRLENFPEGPQEVLFEDASEDTLENMLEDTVEELLEEGPGEITIEVEEETSPGIQLESLPESLMEEIPGILATPSPLLNNPSRESLSPSEFLPSGSEQITLEIHLDLSSLPEALRNSLKPFLSGDLQIPMSIQISPKKEK